MSQAVAEKSMSEAEYLAFEARAKTRHEFMDGEIFAMSGATRKHNLITSNVSRVVGNELVGRDCEIYSSDFRVQLRLGHYVYPDVVIASGDIQTDHNETTLLNPTVIVEVLSKSTEKRDRNDKREDYFNLASVQEYVLITQDRVKVEHYQRQNGNKWTLEFLTDIEDTLELASINCRIPLKYIYLKVALKPLKLVETKKKNGKQRG